MKALCPLFKDRDSLKILDIAAASGEPSISLAKALPQAEITATDIAETYVTLCQERVRAAGVKNVSFLAADGENLHQFADANFDAVTCSLGLMFFSNEVTGLSEFHRVLKPGGVLAVATWADVVPFFTLSLKAADNLAPPTEDDTRRPVATAMRFGNGKSLCQNISDVGFVDVDHHQFDVTFRVSNEGPDGWWGRLLKTPFPLKAAIQTAVKKGMSEEEAELKGKELLRAEYEAANFIHEDGSLAASGNMCNFMLARKQ